MPHRADLLQQTPQSTVLALPVFMIESSFARVA
jgi:hypothetical protein